jgi:photosystem II stability/assembly factor-like uncharacterized protein
MYNESSFAYRRNIRFFMLFYNFNVIYCSYLGNIYKQFRKECYMKKFFYGLILLALLSPEILSQTGDGENFWSLNTNSTGRVYAIAEYAGNPNVMFAGGLDQGVYFTSDGGLNWEQRNNGLLNTQVQALAVAPDNPIGYLYVYAGTAPGANAGVYRSSDGGLNWVLINNGIAEPNIGIQALLSSPFDPFTLWVCVFDGATDAVNGIYRTTDAGDNWFPVTNGLGSIKNFLSLAVSPAAPNTIYLGSSFSVATSTGPTVIYKSTDGGVNWVLSSNGLPTDSSAVNPVRFIAISPVDPNFLVAGLFMNTTDGGAYFSTDGGDNWVKKWNGAPADVGTLLRSGAICPFVGYENDVYVGLDRSTGTNIGVWRTTDEGNNWESFNGNAMLDTYSIRALLFGPILLRTANTLYAGCASTVGAGIYEFTFPYIPVEFTSFTADVNGSDVLLSWSTATETNNAGFSVERKGSDRSWATLGFVKGQGSSAEINNYTFVDHGVPYGSYTYRLKQTDYDGTYKYSIEINAEVLAVNTFSLLQNYPNPFNPTTTITYSLKKDGFVTLKVYDILGKEVADLVNQNQKTGYYTINFNASNLPSGVYIYTLRTLGFASSKKMLLVK